MTMIILDRDGVINFDSDQYIKSPEEWHPIPGSLEAIAALNRKGFEVCIATNQSGIARGYYDQQILTQIHQKLADELKKVGGEVRDFFFCPHHPEEGCVCRKPKPGLLFAIRQKYQLDLSETFFIGDSIVDIQAGLEAGCKPILVLTGKGSLTLQKYPDLSIPFFSDLAAAVQHILDKK